MYNKDRDKRIDFRQITSHHAQDMRRRATIDECEKVGWSNILLTDCLTERDSGGLHVLVILHNRESEVTGDDRTRYKIKVLIDRWGQPVKPGDKIEWLFDQRARDPLTGKKYTNQMRKTLTRMGRADEFQIHHSATVDKHGCIEVGLYDAQLLLSRWGVHPDSQQPLGRYHETATDPVKDPQTGKMRLQHFWRYQEVPAWEYAELSKKRTRKPKQIQAPAEDLKPGTIEL